MESLRELYKIGVGPSSSHTMGPQKAAFKIKETYQDANHYEVYLHGSLALTGKGHLTDKIIEEVLGKENVEIHFVSEELPKHPNGMIFKVYQDDKLLDSITVYSIGGGALLYDDDNLQPPKQIYPHKNLNEILEYCDKKGINLYDYVLEFEGDDFKAYLYEIVDAMFASVEADCPMAHMVSEENASGHRIVTAPTCGASGVLPAVMYYCYKQLNISKKEIIKALAVAGVFGNVIKANATISGADGGCQAEIGSACSMAAAGYGWILELNNNLIQYAAEMGLEHNLGLTCDPVGGYVQIPCIERNGFGALRAMDAAMYAKQLGYLRKNKVSFDAVVRVMKQTGKDLNSAYKETSLGGLAKEFGFEDEN